ncbi:hypothetical protein AVEN_248691-1 [Araneus ventricosus]|uniref:Uncharacterized protein n=1 Tax=Araneus ventricosus TaxID=182803 RepID=A0A4Y2C0A2_ARAVE|nr:hypothetical protein AVEN_248691-1 [Araneus ventricosus]
MYNYDSRSRLLINTRNPHLDLLQTCIQAVQKPISINGAYHLVSSATVSSTLHLTLAEDGTVKWRVTRKLDPSPCLVIQISCMTAHAIARVLSPSSHHRPWPYPSRRRYVLSLEKKHKPPTLLYPPEGMREPAYLSDGFSSVDSRCPPVGEILRLGELIRVIFAQLK